MAVTIGRGGDERKPKLVEIDSVFDVSTAFSVRMSIMTRDDLDQRLLALLQANARESTADLARRLGVARTTVLARIARLEREKVIVGYTARLALDEADAGVSAFVGITVEPRAGRDVVRHLERLPELRELCSVSGDVDYMARVRAESPARLDAVLDRIGEIPGVTRTSTSVVLALRVDRR